ncbi:hypothetical protein, partial [Mycobacteroides abscessus]|uniref:hypothetical protein n=1 Tax=Mycobacteroides abscessus TaxID=36809 RepID=UPI0013FD0B8E
TDPREIDPGGAPLPAPTRPADVAAAAVVEPPAVGAEAVAADTAAIPEAFGSPTDFPASVDVLVPSGAKARARANIAAIETLLMLRLAQRPATLAEQKTLAAWSGWGA